MPALDPALVPVLIAVGALALGALAAGLAAWLVGRHTRRVREAAEAARTAEQASLREVFQSLAVDALAKNSQLFFEKARAGLGEIQQSATAELAQRQQAAAAELAQRQQAVASDLAQRQQAIDTLVAPIKDSLAQMGAQLAGIEKERHGHYASLVQQLRQVSADHSRLQTETASLVRALRHAPARGRWGELQLRRVVELAGMLEHCDFSEQETLGVERRLRPDLVVKLPGGKSIIVDAKAPLEAYLDAHETTDDGERESKLKDHARQVRQHVTSLGAKQYWAAQEGAPDFVVLFLPGEPFFSAALQYDPSLVEYAVSERVMLTSPTSLITLLRAVHYGWQQERIAEEAQRISALGRELYERLATLGKHFEKVGGAPRQGRRRLQRGGRLAGDARPRERAALQGARRHGGDGRDRRARAGRAHDAPPRGARARSRRGEHRFAGGRDIRPRMRSAVVLIGVLAWGAPSAAQVEDCGAKKLAAGAAYVQARANCLGKALAKGLEPDPLCITKALDKLSKGFAKAEAKGGCASLADLGPTEDVLGDALEDGFDAVATNELVCCDEDGVSTCTFRIDAQSCLDSNGAPGPPGSMCQGDGSCGPPTLQDGGPCCEGVAVISAEFEGACAAGPSTQVFCTDPELDFLHFVPDAWCHPGAGCVNASEPARTKCTSTQVKALGKHIAAVLKCHAKAAKKGVPVDLVCLGKAESGLNKAFTSAEKKGDCLAPAEPGPVLTLGNEAAELTARMLVPETTVCCQFVAGCFYVEDAADCTALGFVTGTGECDGDGTCKAPPLADGDCCQGVPNLGAVESCIGGATSIECANVSGEFVSDARCVMGQACIQ